MSIYILCPWNIRTGGPEALHQLSDALIEHQIYGLPHVRLVYYDPAQIEAIAASEPQEGYRFGARKNMFTEYAHYRTEPADVVQNAPGDVVIMPEALCHIAPKFDKAAVVIWWLSVDNAFGALSRVNLNRLRDPRIKHLVQSEYARNFLLSLGITPLQSLGDYSADVLARVRDVRPVHERERIALFNANPHKVAADIDAIIARVMELDPTAICKKLDGRLSSTETAEAMAEARVFVDLGSFPGKDRMPREAAQLGCSVLISRHGAAKEMFVHGMYLSGDDEARNVAHLIEHPDPARCSREGEAEQFFREVRSVFSDL